MLADSEVFASNRAFSAPFGPLTTKRDVKKQTEILLSSEVFTLSLFTARLFQVAWKYVGFPYTSNTLNIPLLSLWLLHWCSGNPCYFSLFGELLPHYLCSLLLRSNLTRKTDLIPNSRALFCTIYPFPNVIYVNLCHCCGIVYGLFGCQSFPVSRLTFCSALSVACSTRQLRLWLHTGLVYDSISLYQLCQRVLGSLVQDLRHLSSTASPSPSNPQHSGGGASQPESSDGEDAPVLPTPTSASFVTSTPAGGFLAPRITAAHSRSSRRALTSRSTGTGGGVAHFHSKASRVVFAVSFSESIILFVLVICQSLDILSER